MSAQSGSVQLNSTAGKSRKYEMLFAFVIIIVCGGVFSQNSAWTGGSSDKEQALVGSRLINRSPGEKSAIPPLQKPNDQSVPASVFSTASSWFGSRANDVPAKAQTNSQSVATFTDGHTPSHPDSPVHQSQHTVAKATIANTIHPTSSTNSTSTGSLTREQCKDKYGERKYLSLDQKKLPPMLYTFPGAGNTWCRLLIEYSTGIYTGSVYNDKSLLQSLPGEFTCNWQVSAIKVHPHTHPFEHLRTGHFHSDAEKCPRGNVNRIKRAILVIRDPFDSIWSEFQRRVTQSHVGGILKSSFDWHKWQANAASLAHAYHLMWAVQHAGIEKHYPPNDYLYIKYEDLKNKATRVETLRKIAQFLSISKVETERLECAFALADKRDTHRVVNKEVTMTKEEAYTVPLACRMWSLFGTHAAKHGYTMWKNLDCTHNPETPDGHYPPIPRVNVGPQGEYDKRWVKPGGKLIDFGGHAPNHPDVGKPKKPNSGGAYGKAGGIRSEKKNRPPNNNNNAKQAGNTGALSGGKPQRPAHLTSDIIVKNDKTGTRITTSSDSGSSNNDKKTAAEVAAAIAAASTTATLSSNTANVDSTSQKLTIEELSAAARSEFRQQKRKEGKQGRASVIANKGTIHSSGASAGVKVIQGGTTSGATMHTSDMIANKGSKVRKGMTIQQASEKDAVISQVGAEKPAWA